MKEPLQIAEQIEKEARASGARAAEVLVTTDDRVAVSSLRDAVDRIRETRVRLRVVADDGRVGVASAPEAAGLVAAALADAAASTAAGVLPPRLDVSTRGIGILDGRYASLDDEGRRDALDWNQESCAGVAPSVQPLEFTYEEVLQTRAYLRSGGRPVAESATRYRLSGSACLKSRPDVTFRAANTSRNFAEVASRPLGVVLGRRVLRSETSSPLPSAPVPVLLSQSVVAELLPRLLRGFRAERIETGFGVVSRSAGARIASPHLHVVDDARLPGGFATRSFDDRGVPSIDMSVIKEGHLGAVYQGVESASAADVRPTGHETFDGGLWMGNLVVRPGSRSRNMLLPDLGRVAEVEELVGPVRVDDQTGSVSFAGHVFLKDVAEDAGYVGVQRMESTLTDLLGAVHKVCSDHERHGIVDTPTWILQGVWFTS